MAASQDPEEARRGRDRRRRHSVAGTDPLYRAHDDDRPTAEFPRADEAVTADLPAVGEAYRADIVDYRQPPDPATGRSALERRRYTGRHRPPIGPEPTRLGLSTAGMTMAVGILGAALTFLHTDSTPSAERARTPIPVTSPSPSAPSSEGAGAPSPRAAPLMPGADPAPAPTPTAGAPAHGNTDGSGPEGAGPDRGGATDGGQEPGGGRHASPPPRASSPRPGNPGRSGTPKPAPGPTQAPPSCDPSTDPDGGDDDNDPSSTASAGSSETSLTRLDATSVGPTTEADPTATPSPGCS